MGASRSNPLAFDSLRDLAAGLGRTSDQGVRRKLAELYARGRAVQLFALLLREETQAGRLPGARGSVAKLAGSELGRFAGNVAEEVLGDQLAAYDSDAMRGVATMIIAAPGSAIAGGTSEIQRNIIGERVLGLAKDPGVDRATPFNQLRVGTQREPSSH
jgi:alkylation response protein AidB-like acyl-CoA dehydrogenase